MQVVRELTLITLTQAQSRDVMVFSTKGLYGPTPLALNESVLRWCKDTGCEIPDFDLHRDGPRLGVVVLSFFEPDAAMAFKLRWL